MGDPHHIAKLDKGVEAWNSWRQQNPRIQPNLTRADLSGRDHTNIDFWGAGLFKANPADTVLAQANLRQARLVETDFTNANLIGVHVGDYEFALFEHFKHYP